MKSSQYKRITGMSARGVVLLLTSASFLMIPLLVFGVSVVYGHSDGAVEGSVQDMRADAMSGVGRTMRSLSRIRGNGAQDAQKILSLIPVLRKGAGDNYTKLFPIGSNSKEASPAIWQDFVAFKALSDEFNGKITQLEQIAEQNRESDASFSQTLNSIKGDLGQSCKSCHSRFRLG